MQVKWSHYWPRHLNLELAGDVNLELFVINYLFGSPGAEPWDFWLQCLRQNDHEKLPLSDFCKSVLLQIGVPERDCHVWYPGYSREIDEVETPRRSELALPLPDRHQFSRSRALQHRGDHRRVSSRRSAQTTMWLWSSRTTAPPLATRRSVARSPGDPAHRIEYISEFTDKQELIALYKSCDAFVSAHRGEGFGMKILDAMACGLPVVTPLFGGPTAYCEPDNCFPVDFLAGPHGRLPRYALRVRSRISRCGPRWIRRASREQMRRVYDDRAAANGRRCRRASDGAGAFLVGQRRATRLIEITGDLRAQRARSVRATRAEDGGSRRPNALPTGSVCA